MFLRAPGGPRLRTHLDPHPLWRVRWGALTQLRSWQEREQAEGSVLPNLYERPHHRGVTIPRIAMGPQLEKNHVVPTSWQDEALARDRVSREVPCSALNGEKVPDSLPATPKSSPTRRVPSRGGTHGLGTGWQGMQRHSQHGQVGGQDQIYPLDLV